jgi:hypothetical protein
MSVTVNGKRVGGMVDVSNINWREGEERVAERGRVRGIPDCFHSLALTTRGQKEKVNSYKLNIRREDRSRCHIHSRSSLFGS